MSSVSPLLDPAFVRELEAMRRTLRARARSGARGDHVATRRGSSAEFLEHRPYAPGDDPRRMDWPAFARTGSPVLKLFHEEEDVVVRLVIDASASLQTGEPPKLLVAKRLAAALGYLALASSERAQVLPATDGLVRARAPLRGRGCLARLLREIDAVEAERGTDLARAVDDVVLRSARPGMLVVLSDFLDAGPFAAAVGRAASAGHDLVLVQVLAPEEVDPPWEGDVALQDAETGALVELNLDERALAAYLARLAALVDALRATAKKHGASYVRVRTNDGLVDVVRRLVSRAVD
jgi:uncharacterized protein (DUF58 family)